MIIDQPVSTGTALRAPAAQMADLLGGLFVRAVAVGIGIAGAFVVSAWGFQAF